MVWPSSLVPQFLNAAGVTQETQKPEAGSILPDKRIMAQNMIQRDHWTATLSLKREDHGFAFNKLEDFHPKPKRKLLRVLVPIPALNQ